MSDLTLAVVTVGLSLTAVTAAWILSRGPIVRAQERKLLAEASWFEAQAGHEDGLAEHAFEQARTQECNTKIGKIQVHMQENTRRLQTSQVDAEIEKLGIKPPAN